LDSFSKLSLNYVTNLKKSLFHSNKDGNVIAKYRDILWIHFRIISYPRNFVSTLKCATWHLTRAHTTKFWGKKVHKHFAKYHFHSLPFAIGYCRYFAIFNEISRLFVQNPPFIGDHTTKIAYPHTDMKLKWFFRKNHICFLPAFTRLISSALGRKVRPLSLQIRGVAHFCSLGFMLYLLKGHSHQNDFEIIALNGRLGPN
jgi:hypothetical protein